MPPPLAGRLLPCGTLLGHRPENGHAVFLCRGDEPRHIDLLGLRKSHAIRWLAHLEDKVCESAACRHQEHAGGLRPVDAEAVRRPARAESVAALLKGYRGLADDDGHFS